MTIQIDKILGKTLMHQHKDVDARLDKLENNEEIIRIANKYPDRFIAFPTIHPTDEGNLELIQDYVRRGAQGLKLYLGHGGSTGKGPFHVMPLDDSRMDPIYEWCEKTQLPIIFHINLLKFYDEFIRVMEAYPYLRVDVPHFGLLKNTQARLERFGWLLDRYPNMYTDFGFGWYEFHIMDFEKLAAWPKRFRTFMSKYSHKIMYSADMVLEPSKDVPYIRNTIRSYFQMLEMHKFRFFYRTKHIMRGLALGDEALKTIYEKAPQNFLLMDDKGQLPNRVDGSPQLTLGLPPHVKTVEKLPPDSEYWVNVVQPKKK